MGGEWLNGEWGGGRRSSPVSREEEVGLTDYRILGSVWSEKTGCP